MDEIIVRLARAMASHPRLRVLSHLARNEELTPTALAAELTVPLCAVSICLRGLSSAGLIRGRRSGARCHYSFTSPYREQTLSGRMSRWLKGLLGAKSTRQKYRGLSKVRDSSGAGATASLHALHATLFEAATAFTDLRRLQILRHLATHAEATVEDLVGKLSMSPDAVSRHTAKLRRRGYLTVRGKEGHKFVYKLAGGYKTPIHREMYKIVTAAWQKE